MTIHDDNNEKERRRMFYYASERLKCFEQYVDTSGALSATLAKRGLGRH